MSLLYLILWNRWSRIKSGLRKGARHSPTVSVGDALQRPPHRVQPKRPCVKKEASNDTDRASGAGSWMYPTALTLQRTAGRICRRASRCWGAFMLHCGKTQVNYAAGQPVGIFWSKPCSNRLPITWYPGPSISRCPSRSLGTEHLFGVGRSVVRHARQIVDPLTAAAAVGRDNAANRFIGWFAALCWLQSGPGDATLRCWFKGQCHPAKLRRAYKSR